VKSEISVRSSATQFLSCGGKFALLRRVGKRAVKDRCCRPCTLGQGCKFIVSLRSFRRDLRCDRSRLPDWRFPYFECQSFPLPAGHVDRYSATAPAGSIECAMSSLLFQMQLGTSIYSRAPMVYQVDMNDVPNAVRRSPLLATIALRRYLSCTSRHDCEATSRGGVRQFARMVTRRSIHKARCRCLRGFVLRLRFTAGQGTAL